MKTILNEAGPFNRIARETITNPHLSLKAKGLLTLILGFPEEWDFSIAGLMPFLREGRESIMSALRELAENGHITKTVRRSEDGRFCKYDYAFYDLPQTALPISAEPVPGSPRVEEPTRAATEELSINKSRSNPNIKERIKALMAYEPFLHAWEKLKATPKWQRKTPGELQVALETLADYSPGEATALAKAALKNKWALAVYDSSSKKILEAYHKKHPALHITINPPKPPEPQLSLEEVEIKNRDSILSMAQKFYQEMREKKAIQAVALLPIANVFDFLLSSGAIQPDPERLEAIGKLPTEKERYAAKRKLLEETFAGMISRGDGLTIPSNEG